MNCNCFKILLFFFNTVFCFSQANIPVGPIYTHIPDPLIAHSQEERALEKEYETLRKVAIQVGPIELISNAYLEYHSSLMSVSTLLLQKQATDMFIDECIKYVLLKNSFLSVIPGLQIIMTRILLSTGLKIKKIRDIKQDLNVFFIPTNAMTEGERKVILLKSIRRALILSI